MMKARDEVGFIWLGGHIRGWSSIKLPFLTGPFVFGGRVGVVAHGLQIPLLPYLFDSLNIEIWKDWAMIQFAVKKGWESPCTCWLWWQRCAPSASAASVSPTNQTFHTQCISFFCSITLAPSLLHMPLLSCSFLLCVFSTSLCPRTALIYSTDWESVRLNGSPLSLPGEDFCARSLQWTTGQPMDWTPALSAGGAWYCGGVFNRKSWIKAAWNSPSRALMKGCARGLLGSEWSAVESGTMWCLQRRSVGLHLVFLHI